MAAARLMAAAVNALIRALTAPRTMDRARSLAGVQYSAPAAGIKFLSPLYVQGAITMLHLPRLQAAYTAGCKNVLVRRRDWNKFHRVVTTA
jgi:hypothetical protein